MLKALKLLLANHILKCLSATKEFFEDFKSNYSHKTHISLSVDISKNQIKALICTVVCVLSLCKSVLRIYALCAPVPFYAENAAETQTTLWKIQNAENYDNEPLNDFYDYLQNAKSLLLKDLAETFIIDLFV